MNLQENTKNHLVLKEKVFVRNFFLNQQLYVCQVLYIVYLNSVIYA